MAENNSDKNIKCPKKRRLINLRSLRMSLKYRPEILNLILKMRHCIKKKNTLIKSLKEQLEKVKTSKNKLFTNEEQSKISKTVQAQSTGRKEKKYVKEATDSKSEEPAAWITQSNGKSEKSIAEQVKEVAQSALQDTGMVYVESAGMYYDYKTGYYYNTDLGLYYHTDTGCYYYYSNEKQTFVFHSYPDKSAENKSLIAHEKKKAKKHKKEKEEDGSKPKRKKTSRDSKKKKQGTNENEITEANRDIDEKEVVNDIENVAAEELEDGECSDTSSELSDAGSDASTSTASDDESVAKHHPPCMRVIVRETNLPKLKVGSLYLITKDGGTIGREGDHHSIVIRDHNVSRNHLDINYDMDKRMYLAIDLGSKNGTIINGIRISESQERSSPVEIVHGSTIQLGETKLLCHIHAGNDTCGHCEPGLIMETQEKEKVAYTRTCSVQKQHQLELARLKNKYAPKPLAIEETAYNDRAQARREKVGSSHHSEKTQSSDINTFIAAENKGFKLLEKMGWSKGEGLGKDSQGDREPIPLVSNDGKAGLGAGSAPAAAMASKTLGPATLRLAARTKMLQPPAKAFQQPMDEDSE
ncbi:angiogenic factor with G patch and FHA domains 1 isoform X2 [Vanessa atalanta]|uniref:angiogenic factor with G patch and FHA domains 1 isoform X2 n=1 Tax=Vanessa atalanta TaxID=42275 RepID=UPI001FCD273B|nr:angiogenic factor with G patch and FHA domains 1 isoform X2 [Vanessa atalanta]